MLVNCANERYPDISTPRHLQQANSQGFSAQLHHLDLEYDARTFRNPVHNDYLEVLACCPNLTTLHLGIGAPIYDADLAHISPVILPNVHTFRSSVYLQTPYLSHFFDALRMPQLRHFEIKKVNLALGSSTCQPECLPCLARCADTLESVCFHRIDIADPMLLSCLAQLHRLKRMSILPGILRLNHGLITALTHDDASDENAHICLALEVLQMRCSSIVPVDAVVQLVASRYHTLKQFLLQFASFQYGLDTRDDKIKDVEARLREYVEGGLQVVLTKSSNSG
ncbi:hypothetical protein JVU11DRAFT_8793 [Chiua virens]|nr:hypothetical protein JVU11DRAFT_8793 [Chiua virens]